MTGFDPVWITHNTGPRTFTVPKTTENAAAGAYPITIRNEISVPVDAEKSSYNLMVVEYTFTIYITPCQVNSYIETSLVGDLVYEIATPGIVSPGYVFDESPICNYPETVTVTGLPTFMVFDEPNARFELPETADLSLIGIYTFVVRSEIEVPEDYTMSTTRIMFVEETVTVTVNPCQVDTYEATV